MPILWEWNRIGNICKSEYIVGAPFASLSLKHRIDRTTYSIENSHLKGLFTNKEKQIQIFSHPKQMELSSK